MRYVSTRGEAPALGFSDAVLAGLALGSIQAWGAKGWVPKSWLPSGV